LHISNWLGIPVKGYPRLYLVEDYDGMRLRAPGAPPWAVAVCRRDDVIVFRRDRIDRTPRAKLPIVLSHELVHHVIGHLGGLPLPRWFEEGLCVYHAGTSYFDTDTTLERLAAAGSLPSLADVDRNFAKDERSVAIAYQVGNSAITRFIERFGAPRLRQLLGHVRAGLPFQSAFYKATGENLSEFESEWRDDLMPGVPYLVFILLENIETTLFFFAALLVLFAWLRWRLYRRRRELEALDREG